MTGAGSEAGAGLGLGQGLVSARGKGLSRAGVGARDGSRLEVGPGVCLGTFFVRLVGEIYALLFQIPIQ